MAAVSILTTMGVAYVFGVQGIKLIVAVILGFFPVAMVLSSIGRRLVPPKLLICDENDINDS